MREGYCAIACTFKNMETFAQFQGESAAHALLGHALYKKEGPFSYGPHLTSLALLGLSYSEADPQPPDPPDPSVTTNTQHNWVLSSPPLPQLPLSSDSPFEQQPWPIYLFNFAVEGQSQGEMRGMGKSENTKEGKNTISC